MIYGELSVIGWKKVQEKPYVLLLTVSILLIQTHYFVSQTCLRLSLFKDIFKLKLLKFYYKLTCDLLLSYFRPNTHLDVINRAPPGQLRINLIHPPIIKRNYANCGLLSQLVDLVNSLQIDPIDTILAKFVKKNSYDGLAFNVTLIYLDAYDLVCRLNIYSDSYSTVTIYEIS